jgi:acetolactate synthase-1/2/3 large subunit
MGWALPAAIGGALAFPRKSICCVVGDGSLMMNIQELATLKHHGLAVKILLLDNSGYSMVRQTETQWLGGVNVGTSTESGLGFPDFIKLAQAFGLETRELAKSAGLRGELAGIFASPSAKRRHSAGRVWISYRRLRAVFAPRGIFSEHEGGAASGFAESRRLT